MIEHLGGAIDQQSGLLDAVVLHRAHEGQGIPACQQYQRGTGEDRIEQAGIFTGNPELGHKVQADALRIKPECNRQEAGAGVEHVAVGMNAALGQSGGAAGVVQRSDIIEVQFGQVVCRCNSLQGRQHVDAIGDRQFGRLQQIGHRDGRLGRAEFGQAGADHQLQAGLCPNVAHDR